MGDAAANDGANVAPFARDEIVAATGARVLRGEASSFRGVSTDSRTVRPGELFVALRGELLDGHAYLKAALDAGAAGLVVSSTANVPTQATATVFEVDDTLQALGALAKFHRQRFKVPVIAVTGSNGKTTEKELIRGVLSVRGKALATEGNLNNEIGVPLTLFRLTGDDWAAVVEMGMNHVGEIARLTAMAAPDVGLITAIHPAHLEGLGSIEAIAQAKGELFVGLDRAATAVVNLDDPHVVRVAAHAPPRRVTYGRNPEADVRLRAATPGNSGGYEVSLGFRGTDYAVKLKLFGEHNALNAAGAFAVGVALGLDPAACADALGTVRGARHRLEWRVGKGGTTILDDAYNANPESMVAALRTAKSLATNRRAVAVLGDMLELGPAQTLLHETLGKQAAAAVQVAAFFGPRSEASWRAASHTLGPQTRHFTDVAELTAWVEGERKPGDVILVKGSRGMRLERVVDALAAEAHD